MANDIIKIKIDTNAFLETLEKLEDGSGYIFDESAVFRYIADILKAAGIEAEAQYQDTDWSIVINDKKHFIGIPSYDDPATNLLHSLRYFADEVNSSNDFEAWYSYSKGDHFINLKQKEPVPQPEA